MEDEESVLVASPFAYITPPMPPRDQVSNTKTTKAMAKIVEDVGTPDSVIRKLSFLNPLASQEALFDSDDSKVGTVRKVRSLDEEDEEEFRFPLATPSADMSQLDVDTSSDGYARFSLSMVDLNPSDSPAKPIRPTASCGDLGSLLPDMLINCGCCGKQFISKKHLEGHSMFCTMEGQARCVSQSETSTLAQTSDCVKDMRSSQFSFASHLTDSKEMSKFTESPALPLYMQRAQKDKDLGLPAVAPLPLPNSTPPPSLSPSMLASPTLREDEEDFLEEEISTFLECLRSDVGEMTDRQKLWACRKKRQSPLLARVQSENSLFDMSSDEEVGKLVLVPVLNSSTQPSPNQPSPPARNLSVSSPIPQRCSFEYEQSMSASFLHGGLPLASPDVSVIGPSLSRLKSFCSPGIGRASPTFGPLVGESTVTLMRLSIRFPCKSCGRRFGSEDRQAKHEAACVQGKRVDSVGRGLRGVESVSRVESVKSVRRPRSYTEDTVVGGIKPKWASDDCVSCRHCQRTFNHADKLARHEPICLSVFRRERSTTPKNNTSSLSNTSMKTTVTPVKLRSINHRRRPSFLSLVKNPSVTILPVQCKREFRVQVFQHAFHRPVTQIHADTLQRTPHTNQPSLDIQGFQHTNQRTPNTSQLPTQVDTSSVGSSRTSLEFQYSLLREQIRTCSDRLRLRRSVAMRDG